MKKKTAPPKYTPEVRERAIRLLEEVRAQHPSDWSAIQAIASKIGCNPETLRAWYRKHQDTQNPARYRSPTSAGRPHQGVGARELRTQTQQ